jgi:GNAT superfamily N-acetyltransferase
MPTHNLIEIAMARQDLDNLPCDALPAPFSVRNWKRGDLAAWLRIQQEADKLQQVSEETFRFFYGHDEDEFGRRILFLLDGDGREIGTASAWLAEPLYGPGWARVHWVAIVPDMQGKGLARPFMAAVLRRMNELGHAKAYLTTESARDVAIKLYRSLGFGPMARNDEERKVWEELGDLTPGRSMCHWHIGSSPPGEG